MCMVADMDVDKVAVMQVDMVVDKVDDMEVATITKPFQQKFFQAKVFACPVLAS